MPLPEDIQYVHGKYTNNLMTAIVNTNCQTDSIWTHLGKEYILDWFLVLTMTDFLNKVILVENIYPTYGLHYFYG